MAMDAGVRYRQLCEQVTTYALQYGRVPSEVGIVAVTKGQPLTAIVPLYHAGCRDVGESRVQEVLPKITAAPVPFRWHLIGSLQKNKVHKIIGQFVLIHSVDSVALATKIATASLQAGCTTSILLQVNTSGEAAKHGFLPADLTAALDCLLPLPGLAIQGLMTMAPAEAPTSAIAACFGRLRLLRDLLTDRYALPLPLLSMGMSHDYPIAIAEGATLLRVGSALFAF